MRYFVMTLEGRIVDESDDLHDAYAPMRTWNLSLNPTGDHEHIADVYEDDGTGAFTLAPEV